MDIPGLVFVVHAYIMFGILDLSDSKNIIPFETFYQL